MAVESQLAARFVCCKCDSRGASVDRFAATGTGISRLMNLQHKQFIAATCRRCGYTEIYNPSVFGRGTNGMDVLDVIFGA